jgi:hypothetical protein
MIEKFAGWAVFVMIGLLAWVLYLVIYPVTIMKPNVQPYPINSPTVEVGETIYFTADYCKYKQIPATINRTLINNSIIFITEQHTNLPAGCNKQNVPVQVPLFTPPGEYYIQSVINYKVNALREKSYIMVTDKICE